MSLVPRWPPTPSWCCLGLRRFSRSYEPWVKSCLLWGYHRRVSWSVFFKKALVRRITDDSCLLHLPHLPFSLSHYPFFPLSLASLQLHRYYFTTSPECSRWFRVVFKHYQMHSEKVFLITFPSQILKPRFCCPRLRKSSSVLTSSINPSLWDIQCFLGDILSSGIR